jgi:A/G-specific adenine glycosylase
MSHTKIVRRLLDWFANHARDLPWRRTRDPYAIWVSEIMLQQTQVKTVVPYWNRWMRQMPNVRTLAQAKASRLHKLWEGLGYYTRVRNMQKAARVIMKDYGGKFPQQFEDILALPGIGRYTAGAICSIAFNRPYPVLDGNVIRVLTRVFGIEGNPRESQTNALLWRLAENLVQNAFKLSPQFAVVNSIVPVKVRLKVNVKREAAHKTEEFRASNLNQSLMELGALICTARQPKCEVCPVAKFCVAFKEDRTEALPTATPRPRVSQRHIAAFILEHEGRCLVRQRPADTVNAHLWEFPNVELISKDQDVGKAAQQELHLPLVLEAFCTIKHAITRFRITLDVYRAAIPNGITLAGPVGSRWLSQAALDRLPFASAHRKILLKLRTHATRAVRV